MSKHARLKPNTKICLLRDLRDFNIKATMYLGWADSYIMQQMYLLKGPVRILLLTISTGALDADQIHPIFCLTNFDRRRLPAATASRWDKLVMTMVMNASLTTLNKVRGKNWGCRKRSMALHLRMISAASNINLRCLQTESLKWNHQRCFALIGSKGV